MAEWPGGIRNCVSRLGSFSSNHEAGETVVARGEERKDGNEPLVEPNGCGKTSLNLCPCSSSKLAIWCQQYSARTEARFQTLRSGSSQDKISRRFDIARCSHGIYDTGVEKEILTLRSGSDARQQPLARRKRAQYYEDS